MPAVDSGPGPDDHVVTFRIPRRRVFLTMMSAAAASWLVINGCTALLEFGVGDGAAMPEPVALLVSVVVYILIFLLVFVASIRRHPAWVAVSDKGLEVAGTGRDPAFLPWSAVESVDRRFVGPFTDLVVTPTEMDAAQIVRRGWSRPRTIVRGERRSIVVDAGLMEPGPTAVLAEIDRRRPARF